MRGGAQRLRALARDEHELDPARLLPHPGPLPKEGTWLATGGKSGALRAAIFGINDGLVSNLSLIMGLAGADATDRVVVVAAVAGLLAGACSMAAGEYVSMRVQREALAHLLHLEAHRIATDERHGVEALERIYEEWGIPAELAERTARALTQKPRRVLEAHARAELGLDPDELGSPWAAAASSFLTFAGGAAIPLLAHLAASGAWTAPVAGVVSAAALAGVGAAMATITGRSRVRGAVRMIVVGGLATLVTFGVGRLFRITPP